jgi:diguanylate cyclase (GGDEF)-like protein
MTVNLKRDEASRLAELRSLGILDTPAEDRYDRLTRLAKRAFNVPFAAFSLLEEQREWLKSQQGLEFVEHPDMGSLSREAIGHDGTFVVQDALQDKRFSAFSRETGIKFYAGHPVRTHRGYAIGTLWIADTTPRSFSKEDEICLKDLVMMVEEEITVQTVTNIDDLTSLFNRRGFYGIGQQAIAICKRMHKPATVMFFDLDGYNEVNEDYGQSEGEKLLKNIGSVLSSVFRNSDVVARIGGSEFCVLLTGTDTDHITRPLENLTESIRIQNQHTPYDIGYSVGVIEYDKRHETLSTLMQEADNLNYQQKCTPQDTGRVNPAS